MTETMRRGEPQAGRATADFALRILLLVLALLSAPALAASQKSALRLANLQIEIWPEYDRAAALVILKGELAADIALPTAVSLRIAASSGGPTAVAYSTGPGANLLNLNYGRKDAGEFITVSFDLPGRYFHVEFYEPIATGKPERDYAYVWPGDLAVERLRVIVQEPAVASQFSVAPDLDATATGQDGLRYRSADLGAVGAGKPLPIKLRYTRTDARTSSEILKLKAPEAPSVPATDSGKASFGWVLMLGAIPALLIGAGAAFLWWWRRRQAGAATSNAARFCAKCGAPSAAGDRYCAKCGARLK